jgi:hypothetical protein
MDFGSMDFDEFKVDLADFDKPEAAIVLPDELGAIDFGTSIGV